MTKKALKNFWPISSPFSFHVDQALKCRSFHLPPIAFYSFKILYLIKNKQRKRENEKAGMELLGNGWTTTRLPTGASLPAIHTVIFFPSFFKKDFEGRPHHLTCVFGADKTYPSFLETYHRRFLPLSRRLLYWRRPWDERRHPNDSSVPPSLLLDLKNWTKPNDPTHTHTETQNKVTWIRSELKWTRFEPNQTNTDLAKLTIILKIK